MTALLADSQPGREGPAGQALEKTVFEKSVVKRAGRLYL
jgi:hypothetical protein